MRSLFLAGFLAVALFGLAAAQAPPDQAPPDQAGATLRFTPTRLILDAHRPRGAITVTASEDVTVDVDFIDRVMTEQGAILDLEEARTAPGAEDAIARLRSAAPMLAPVARRLRLRPGQPVVIEVALAGPRAAGGEFRTHLTVTPVAPAPGEGAAPPKVTWRYALPMIVRGPNVRARAALAIPRPDGDGVSPPPRDAVDIEVWRAGDHSLYGDLIVKDANGETLAAVDGLAVYPEIDRRVVRLSLPSRPAGPLEVQFVDRDTHPGAVLARLALPQGHRLVEAVASRDAPPTAGRSDRDSRIVLVGINRRGSKDSQLR